MDLSRRELLTASALLLASPKAALSGVGQGAGAKAAGAGAEAGAAAGTGAGAGSKPIVLCWNENP